MVPVNFEGGYTWKMFGMKEPIPNFIPPSIDSIRMERNCTDWMWPFFAYSIKMQPNSISDFDMLDFMRSASRSFRELAKVYMKNQTL